MARRGSPAGRGRGQWGWTITLVMPPSSSIRMNTNPLAVCGRWRATTIPTTSRISPSSCSARRSLRTVPDGNEPASSASGWPLAAKPNTAYSARSFSPAFTPPNRSVSCGWSSGSSSWRRTRRGSRPPSAKASVPPAVNAIYGVGRASPAGLPHEAHRRTRTRALAESAGFCAGGDLGNAPPISAPVTPPVKAPSSVRSGM